ncbi:hypothetical protein A3C09_04185 [Candidatus Uhrbacteria bacterium RIFCSPHIGHO2_02_FULL_47_44]|uniref:Major facilitator superfamily (MFS) profile domain-containing protein n=1 Tax=Candidatus Uhrbacteria bacterium RIFCSPLOWO2_02_FULL_48_18 TaxID=1802408 RepID=A0A1F7V9E5_9BACT|nr:MAG: hypothetical protein A2839_00305 [Candidatus Uhrbacteria bacterium RIFCSPHIGHO2_01_FULL_47_10]OGL71404.1 MAG: hypothetical protein A3C09_04185 [Candidatus Uhrbacteria bacterium RIFCSPHIGHO2_02_FULL_47_44]OGL76172.1 MAG: hypothetical protein A3E97_02985 [Candidatus Uhrbacteria bacterium RIFCSPHIGHO2_12_FULL_47_12]OGL81908.1 MAG: hypothetical protein A3B20_02370 [Candidatus Uhrbacteria bacterium RIFCSPLOWO2_01_FULL_47_17]OGL87071.1 MAG: hypothetical protein A3I41_03960 [Candidatus Uhrbact
MKKRALPIRHYFLQEMNPIVRCLVISDIVWRGSVGFLGPIFALFIAGFIEGGSAEVVGVAMSIYLFTKSLFQIPFSTIIDKMKGEFVDFWFMFIGTIVGALLPLAYLFIHTPMQLYVVQFFAGVFAAAAFPSFMGLFTKHIDKQKEGSEWGIYYTLTDLCAAATAVMGGTMAVMFGFRTLIVVVVVVGVAASLFLLPIRLSIRRTSAKNRGL